LHRSIAIDQVLLTEVETCGVGVHLQPEFQAQSHSLAGPFVHAGKSGCEIDSEIWRFHNVKTLRRTGYEQILCRTSVVVMTR